MSRCIQEYDLSSLISTRSTDVLCDSTCLAVCHTVSRIASNREVFPWSTCPITHTTGGFPFYHSSFIFFIFFEKLFISTTSSFTRISFHCDFFCCLKINFLIHCYDLLSAWTTVSLRSQTVLLSSVCQFWIMSVLPGLNLFDFSSFSLRLCCSLCTSIVISAFLPFCLLSNQPSLFSFSCNLFLYLLLYCAAVSAALQWRRKSWIPVMFLSFCRFLESDADHFCLVWYGFSLTVWSEDRLPFHLPDDSDETSLSSLPDGFHCRALPVKSSVLSLHVCLRRHLMDSLTDHYDRKPDAVRFFRLPDDPDRMFPVCSNHFPDGISRRFRSSNWAEYCTIFSFSEHLPMFLFRAAKFTRYSSADLIRNSIMEFFHILFLQNLHQVFIFHPSSFASSCILNSIILKLPPLCNRIIFISSCFRIPFWNLFVQYRQRCTNSFSHCMP